jgi:DNA-binding IclR family transcriptional regulator
VSTGVDKQEPRSLALGLRMLTLFTAEHTVRSISELADLMGVSRPTAHRYAVTCLELGYLEQAPLRRYRLARGAARLGMTMLESLTLMRHAEPVLNELRNASGRTASLALLDGGDVVYLQRLRGFERGQYELERGLGAGSRLRAESTAAGRALLAARGGCERARREEGVEQALDRVEIDRGEHLRASGLAIVVEANGRCAAMEITLPTDALADEQTTIALRRALSGAAQRLTGELAGEAGREPAL